MVIHKKHSFLLLEMVIAMSLAVTVLSTLSYFYYQINVINREMDRAQNENFQKRYIENRLASIFPKIISPKDPSEDFHFFTSNDLGLFKPGTSSLVFSYDNGVQLDKLMSYHVIGRLFLTPEGHLMLAKWPAKKRWPENGNPPVSLEVLAEDIESLSFSFYVPADKTKVKIKNVDPLQAVRGTSLTTWNKEYRDLPAVIKLELLKKKSNGKEEKIFMAFVLPNTSIPITYND